MIDMRRAVLLLPVYVALMVGVDVLFKSAGLDEKGALPSWLVIGFTVMALAVFVIVARFLVKKARGRVPVSRERTYLGFLVALMLSGFVGDGLKSVAALAFHGISIWISIPLSILSYVILELDPIGWTGRGGS